MDKKHLKYLFLGMIFWGVLISVIVKIVFPKSDDPIFLLIIFYIFATILITLLVQFYLEGFYTGNPKNWFYIPLFSWTIFFIWGCIESLFLGNEFSLLPL